MTDQKKPFLTKLTKILLIILALLTIFIFSLSYIWRHSNSEDNKHDPIPSPEKKTTKPRTFEPLPGKNKKQKKLAESRTEKLTTKGGKKDDERINLLTETLETVVIEAGATSAHLTERLADIVTDDTIDTERTHIIQAYLQHGIDPNQVVDNNSPMFLAARNWNLPLLRELGTIDFSASTSDGWTIMHIICENEPKSKEQKKRVSEILSYLIENGGSVDAVNAKNDYSPLMFAIEKGNSEMASILLNHGADASGPIKKGFEVNPLMLAMRTQNMVIVIHLVEKGAELLAYNKDGISAVQEAVINGFIAGIRFFIGKMKQQGIEKPQDIQVPEPEEGEEMSTERETGATLLHFAVMYNQFDTAKYLVVQRKADRTIRDKKDCLALDHSRNAVNVYTDEAKIDPAQFGEAKKTAENILKLLESTEEDLQQTKANIEKLQHTKLAELDNMRMTEEEDKADDREIERLKALRLL